MQQASVIDVSSSISMSAAKLSAEHKLPLADSLVLTTAQLHKATLWTQDADFKGFDGVQYTKK